MNLFENLQMMKESEDKEPIKCLVNDNGDYINVYKRKSTGKIMAQGNIPGASFNGPWTDEHEKHYKNKGFKEETEDVDVSNERLDQEFYEFLKSKNAQYIIDNLNETEFGLEFDIYNGDWKHEHAYIKQLVREFFDNKGIHGAISSEVIDDSESDTYSAHYHVILTNQNLNEDVNNDKLTIDDLRKYPYKFYETWKSTYNPTYSDDFLNLAEKYNCIKISNPLGPRGGDIGLYYGNWFICKNKEDYESLKTALEESDLNIFIKLSPLTNVDWKLVIDKLDRLTINRYINPYTIKWNSKSKKELGKTLDLKREASYGGAFDIKDDQYFTRDDLDEFANYVMEEVSKLSKYDWVPNLIDIYLEDNQALEMSIEYNDYEYTYSRDIDMRRIKIPHDLITKYAGEYITYFYNEIEKNEEVGWND